jgi:hypothetical protein
MYVLDRLSSARALALAAAIGLSVLGAAGCGHDANTAPPFVATHNAPTTIPPPPNASTATSSSHSAPTAMPPPSSMPGH